MDIASPVPLTLARHMADKGPLWRGIAEREALTEANLSRLVGWSFGDFIFHTENDVISDVNKLYEYGFTERVSSPRSLLTQLNQLNQLRRRRILP